MIKITYAGSYNGKDYFKNENGCYVNEDGQDIFMPFELIDKLKFTKEPFTREVEDYTLKNMTREFVISFNMEANSLKTMTNKELAQYLKSVNEDIDAYRNANGDEFLIACNEIMDNSITIGDLVDGLFKKGIHPDVIKLACRYFIACAVVEELNRIRKGE